MVNEKSCNRFHQLTISSAHDFINSALNNYSDGQEKRCKTVTRSAANTRGNGRVLTAKERFIMEAAYREVTGNTSGKVDVNIAKIAACSVLGRKFDANSIDILYAGIEGIAFANKKK